MSIGLLRSAYLSAVMAALSFTPTAALAGGSPLSGHDENVMFGLMLNEFCVDTFPRFAKAPSAIEARGNFQRRGGKNVWDHKVVAVTIYLTKIDGKSACVMAAVSKKWQEGAWADFAVPAFGAIWDSDQTTIDKRPAHPGDDFRQHMQVRFPTQQLLTFDADRRADGLWDYKIAIIAAQ